MRSIGIDIGTYSIKVAELHYSTKTFQLADVYEIALPQDPGADTALATLEALRRISNHYSHESTRFNISIRQEAICIRNVKFPFTQKYRIEKTLPFELEDELPFDTEDGIIHPKILSFGTNSTEVMAFAAPKPYVQSIIALCNEAGFDPDVVSCEGSALSNLFENWQKAPPVQADGITDTSLEKEVNTAPQVEVDLVLYIGHSKTLMLMVHADHVVSLRSINFGGRDVTNAIQKKYSISPQEALKTMQEKSFLLTDQAKATQDQVTFSNTIASSFDVMVTDVKRHLLSIESQLNIKASQIFIAGGTSKVINLCPYLTQCFLTPVNPMKNISKLYGSHLQVPAPIFQRSFVAVGLALEGIRPNRNPAVNFRKLEFLKKSKTMDAILEKWAPTLKAAVAILAIFFVYTFTKSIVTDNLATFSNTKLKTIVNKVGLKGRTASNSRIAQYIKEQRTQIKAKEDIQKLQSTNSALDILLDVSKKIPSKEQVQMDVKHFNVNDLELTIEGEASSANQVANIKQALALVATDRAVQNQTPTFSATAGKSPFAFRVSIDRNMGISK